MKTWVIMMGLNMFTSIICAVAILWFEYRKDSEFDDFIASPDEKKEEGGVEQ